MTRITLSFPISTSPIAVVGNLNLDYRTSPIPAVPAIMSDGETSVSEISETLGGGGANTAAAAAALGGQVHLIASIGDDSLGRRLEQHLKSMGIQTTLARKPAADRPLDRANLGQSPAPLPELPAEQRAIERKRRRSEAFVECRMPASLSCRCLVRTPIARRRELAIAAGSPLVWHGNVGGYQLGSGLVHKRFPRNRVTDRGAGRRVAARELRSWQ